MARSWSGRLSAAYLAGSHIGQLKLVLIDAPPEAAVKLFHSPTQCALERKAAAYRETHGHRQGKVSTDTFTT